MIHPALRQLLRLQFRGALRRTGRQMRTPKGIAFAVIGALVGFVWLASVAFSTTVGPKSNPEKVRDVAPLALALMCLVNIVGGGGDKAISFTPGEVNFLFPGPFTRRELMSYKLAKTVLGTLAGAAFLSFVLLPYAGGYPAAFAGAFLAFLFMHLLTLALVMTAQVVGERAYTRGRRVVLAVLAAAVVLAVAQALASAGREGFWPFVASVRRSAVGGVLLAPFDVFARLFTARAVWPDLLLWSGIGAAMNAALLALVVRLDADYLEAAAGASQRAYERLQRMRGERRLSSAAAGRPPRGRVPLLPWLGGAGPTAWRQLTTMLRTARGTLVLMVLLCAALAWLAANGKGQVAAFVSGGSWATIVLSSTLKFDFRGDLDQLAWLKAQPVRPTAAAAGQLVAPVLLMTLLHAVLIAAAAAVAPPGQRVLVLLAVPFVVPFNVLLFAVENALFLLFPTRTLGAAAGDLGHVGRQIVFFLLKLVLVAIPCGLAAGLGVAAGMMAGRSLAVGVSVALLTLALAAAAAVPAVGWAYRHFDPSADTPG
jgi:hypothetical protein